MWDRVAGSRSTGKFELGAWQRSALRVLFFHSHTTPRARIQLNLPDTLFHSALRLSRSSAPEAFRARSRKLTTRSTAGNSC